MQPGVPFNLTPAEQEALQQQADDLRTQVMPDLQAALAQAQMMQQKLMEAQQQIAETQVEGQAGNGLVRAVLDGNGTVVSVHIDPSVVDPTDVDTLEDLVVGALANASENMRETVKSILGPLAAIAEQGR
jgi:DNA-binding YbaB/EbfC family protein